MTNLYLMKCFNFEAKFKCQGNNYYLIRHQFFLLNLMSGIVFVAAFNFCLSHCLQNLVKHLPEQEQLNTLAKYKNEYSNLSEPEQFGVVVSTLLHTQPNTRAHTHTQILNGYCYNNMHK